jgi:ABC-type lipoprotein export system ATPase subunit
MNMSHIGCRELTKVYTDSGAPVAVLNGISLEIARGVFAAVMGPSGSGKSTLLHCLGLLETPTQGEILLDGRAVSAFSDRERANLRRDIMGFVFQSFYLAPGLSVLENVMLPMLIRRKACNREQKAAHTLNRVGLSHRLGHKPSQLSGGEQQRVAIARAVAGKPELVLADEPTGDLDGENTESILSLMQEFNQRFGITFVVATHNQRIAAAAGCSLELRSGRLSSRPSIL